MAGDLLTIQQLAAAGGLDDADQVAIGQGADALRSATIAQLRLQLLAGVAQLEGKSAFELWQLAGNAGDLDAFFEFLRGGQGIQGETGGQGAQGIQGIPGDARAEAYSLATIPQASTTPGAIARLTDGQKPGEALGAGTGVLVYSDGSKWRRLIDGADALPFAGEAVALDYVNGHYRVGDFYTRNEALLPGRSYARNGAKAELANGAAMSFDANVPAILPGTGYFARTSATNRLNSQAPHWIAIGAGSLGAFTAGGGVLGTNLQAINLGPGVGDGAFVFVNEAVAPGAARCGAFVLRGQAGKTVRIRMNRHGAGTFEGTFSPDIVLTGGYQRHAIPHQFINPQTACRLEILPGVVNPAASVEACFPTIVEGPAPGPLIHTNGTAATASADFLALASPLAGDEDFFFYAQGEWVHGSTGIEESVATIRDGVGGAGILGLSRNSAGFISGFVRDDSGIATQVSAGNIPLSSGIGALGILRRGGKWTLFVKAQASAVVKGPESAATAFPTLSSIKIGQNGLGAQMQGRVRSVRLHRDTFTDAECTQKMDALA